MKVRAIDTLFSRAALLILSAGALAIAFAPQPTPGIAPRVRALDELIARNALAARVPPALAIDLAYSESGIDQAAVHAERGGYWSYGVMQLNSRWWIDPAAMTAEQNIAAGVGYLAEMLRRCRGNETCAVRRYRGSFERKRNSVPPRV